MTERRSRKKRHSHKKILEEIDPVSAEAAKDPKKQPARSREGGERHKKEHDIIKKLFSLDPFPDSLNSCTTSPPKQLSTPKTRFKDPEALKRPRKRVPWATFDDKDTISSICRICGSAIHNHSEENRGIGGTESVAANSLNATPNIAFEWPPLSNSTTNANDMTDNNNAAAAQGQMIANEIVENLVDQSHMSPKTLLSNDSIYSMISDKNDVEDLSHLNLDSLQAIDSLTFGSNSLQNNATDIRYCTDCTNLKSSDNCGKSSRFQDPPCSPSNVSHNEFYHRTTCLDNIISYICNASLQFENLQVLPVTYQVTQNNSKQSHPTTEGELAAHRTRESLSSSTIGIYENCNESDDIMSQSHPASMDYFTNHKQLISDYVKELKQNAKHLTRSHKNNKIETNAKDNDDNIKEINNKKEIVSTTVCDNYCVQRVSFEEDLLNDLCCKILATDTTNSSSITDYFDQHDRLADSPEISGRKPDTSKHSVDSMQDYREEIGKNSSENENVPKLTSSSSKTCRFSSLNSHQSSSPKSKGITRMSLNDPGSADCVPSARKNNKSSRKSKIKCTKQSVFNIFASHAPQCDYQDADHPFHTPKPVHDYDNMRSSSSTSLPTHSVSVCYNVYFCNPKCIFIGGISSSTCDESLHNLFADFGQVVEVNMMRDPRGIHRGFGFITFDKQEVADQLMHDYCDTLVLDNRKLKIGPAMRRLPFSIDHSTLLDLIQIFRQ